jgi:hypothetical protein
MGIDVWMAATPAPHYSDGTIDHLLSETSASMLRRRADAVPAHIIHAAGITQGNFDLDEEEAHAWTHSLLDGAIAESLTFGVGCRLVWTPRVWLVGGGMDTGDGMLWSERIGVLALTGITELPLDAGPRRLPPSVKKARSIARKADFHHNTDDVTLALLRQLGCSPQRARTIVPSVAELAVERNDVLVDLLALTFRSAWVKS